MAIDKLIPQYLNKDEDPRLLKEVEMSNALNIRVSTGDDGNQGVLKNVEGNTAIASASSSDTIPGSGNNRVVGAVSSEAGNCIYFFLYNANGTHGIYQYRHNTDKYHKVLEGSFLNFHPERFVKADVVINQFGDHLLYFTDSRNEPRKINATRALTSGYGPLLTSGTDAQKELFVSVCKQPPQTPITFSFVDDPDIKFNNLQNNCFQFAYQYVYDDGELSALSPYSELAVSTTNRAFNAPAQNFLRDRNNKLLLEMQGSDGPVEKLRVFVRRNNDQAFYRIAEIPHRPSTENGLAFANDGVYTVLPDQEAFKMFDAVPRNAFAQAISNNRLFYGNYLEGFDNLDRVKVGATPIYHPEPDNFNLPGSDRGLQTSTTLDINTYPGLRFFPGTGSFVTNNEKFRHALGEAPIGQNLVDASDENPRLVSFNANGDIAQSGFSVDVSELSDFTSVEAGVLNIDLTIDYSTLGIASFGGEDMLFDHTITFSDGVAANGDAITPNSLAVDNQLLDLPPTEIRGFLLKPIGYNAGGESPQIDQRSLTFDQAGGSQPLNFNSSSSIQGIDAESNLTVQEQFADKIIEILNGQQTSVFVRTRSKKTRFSTGTVSGLGAPAPSDFLLDLDGTVTFMVFGGVYNESTQTVDFRLRVEKVDLNITGVDAQFDVASGTSGISGNVIYNQLQLDPSSIGGPSFTNSAGRTIKDFRDEQSNGTLVKAINHVFKGFNVISNIDYVSEGQSISFKAGATHEFGIVYFDHRNRHGGVQKIDSVDVVHFGDVDRNGNEGRTEVDLRFTHEPPYWATKYAPVYSKNTSYEKILQISVLEAGLPRTETYADPLSDSGGVTRPIIDALGTSSGSDPDGLIYLSMRSLEGKTNSYNESKGANLEYEYQEGDVLRVLRYKDSDGNTVRPMHEFKISSYKRYIDNEENPIKLYANSDQPSDTTYRRTGFFLGIRDQDIPGFNKLDVAAGLDFFTNDCVVEIFRPKLRVENQVFHEVGKTFDIVVAGGSRTHGGDRSNTTVVTAAIRVVSSTSFTSTTRLFVGDRLTPAASVPDATDVFVTGIQPQSGGTFLYTISEGFPFPDLATPGSNFSCTVAATAGAPDSVFPGCITLDTGDVHLKLREILTNPTNSSTGQPDETKPGDQTYKNFIIEDESVSDFFESKAVDIGRPHIETPDQIEQVRSSSVTYSDPFALDSAVLALSSFNPSLFPFKDYNTQHGDVCFLLDRNEALMVMQENKISKTPVSRVLIESAAGGQLVTSTNVLGTPTYYAGNLGPGLQPESVVESFGRVYFVDVARAAVVQLSSEGIDLLSSKSMTSHFQTLFSNINVLDQKPFIPCGYDPDNAELIITSPQIDRNSLTFPDSEGLILSPVKKPASATRTNVDAQAHVLFENGGRDTWDLGETQWDVLNLNWEVSGQGVIYVDKLGDIGSVYLDSSLRNSTDSITVKAVTSSGSHVATGSISARDSSLTLPTSFTRQTDKGSVTMTKSGTNSATAAETSAYSTTKGVWLTFYSFIPEMYARLHDKFFSFKDGVIYKHNSNATRNNFYGSQANSQVSVISRKNPSDIKVYNAMSLEGNKAWKAVVSNSTQTTGASSMQASEFDEREGMFYRVIAKDATSSSTSNSSHKVVLGQVASVDGSKITFTTKVSNLPFGIGDTLFKLASSSESTLSVTVSSVSGRKEITASGAVGGLTAGDTVMAVSDDDINGDKIRDYYSQVDLTNTDTTAVELYAVNLSYSSSPLHNDK
jgi:hypothetical protein